MMKSITILMRPALLLLFLFLTGCITSQEFAVLQQRVVSLEADNQLLQKKAKEHDNKMNVDFIQLEEGVGDVQSEQREKYAELKSTMDTLKHELRMLKGEIEASEYRLSQEGVALADGNRVNRLDKAVAMNYKRLLRLEKHLKLEPLPLDEVGDGADAELTAHDPTQMDENTLYESAKSHLDLGKNEQAREQFEQFIKRFPKSPNADNARFWIADSYYREKWYEKAILEYQRVVEEYPQGNKMMAALLKQGYAFAKLGEKGNARLILKDLIQKYPNSQEAKIARDKLKTL